VRRLLLSLLVAGLAASLVFPAATSAGKKRKPPSGIAGTVLNATCPGPCIPPCELKRPCIYPQAVPPPYTGNGVTVEVRRAGGALVATRRPTDGRFRVKVKRGLYTVSAYLDQVSPPPRPEPVIYPPPPTCGQGDSERVRVFRHRFSSVQLQVADVCIL
jgi:hypothetical protein